MAMHRIFKTLSRVSDYITPHHFAQSGSARHYETEAIKEIIRFNGHPVADVGAGKRWHFPAELKACARIKLVGIDLDAQEMEQNDTLDVKIVEDVCNSISTPVGPYGVITCRAGVEHFHDVEKFLSNCYDALVEHGSLVIWFPNKYAPFAIINQILPSRLSRFLLRNLTQAGADGDLGFTAYYDRTSYSSFRKLALSQGFKIDYFYPSYYSSGYFSALPPVFLLSLCLDYLRFVIGAKNLASHYCFVLRKP